MNDFSQVKTIPRKPLPTKQEIFAIDNLEALLLIRDEVESAQKKIAVDLEFSNRGEEWAARARGALTAHDICCGNIGRRIKQLTGSGNNLEQQIEAKKASAELKKANKANIDAHREVVKLAAEHKKIALQNRIVNVIEKTSFFFQFYWEAKRTISAEVFEMIEKSAFDKTQSIIKSECNEVTK